jgi:CRP-like cAMP-binding protein
MATLSPGTCFGQASLVTGRHHLLDVDAEERCELAVLTLEAFASLAEEELPLRAALIEALLHAAYDSVDRSLRIAAARAASPGI